MDMRKLLSSFLIVALSLPLMAQEVEVKETAGKTEVTVKKNRSDMKAWKQRGDMKRGDMKRGDMAKRKKMARHMKKKRAIRSAVRVIVIGGLAYYIGYTQGEKSHRGGMKRRPPFVGDKK
jgi:hypothetical protein|tara:strand:+ start:442 stop:801 length:360 start_codon:yes stop_codon:yes gene_type:complete